MGMVASIEDRIAQSRKASAVDRAWKVAKALEAERAQIEGLHWVEPKRENTGRLTRRIDFPTEFPDGIRYIQPVPMNVTVIAPASKIVPGEEVPVNWTMPILTRVRPSEGVLDERVRGSLGYAGTRPVRNRIDAVSFLPFPKADAPEEERFTPEFMVALDIDAKLGRPDDYFAAVAVYGEKVIKQMVTRGYPNHVQVYADPYTETHFRAEMLVNLGVAELAATPEDAGELTVFVYRITKGYDTGRIKKNVVITSGEGHGDNVVPLYGEGRTLGGGLTRGFDPFGSQTKGGAYRGLTVVPPVPAASVVTPAAAPKEVGDVRIGEGTRGEAVEYNTLDGYVADAEFAVQPLRIRFLGVREASDAAALDALKQIAGRA